MRRQQILTLVLLALIPAPTGFSSSSSRSGDGGYAASRHSDALVRRPVALVSSVAGPWLYTANRRSGTVSAIDMQSLEVRRETKVAESLADLAEIPGLGLLALDDRASELVSLRYAGPELRVIQCLRFGPLPARLAVDREARRAFVSSSWGRRIYVIEWDEAKTLRLTRSIDLPFPPREMLPVESARRLVVADAFGSRLATLDVEHAQVDRVVEIPGHNIRGLTVQGERLLLTHQRMERTAAEREALVWGVFNTNAILSLDLKALLTPEGDVLGTRRVLDLGGQVIPSGDPDALLATEGGELVAALAGVGRIAIGQASSPRFDQVRVGRRPTALAAGAGGRLYVANTYSDSVSVVDVASRKSLAEISLGPPAELTEADRGEILFYDATLSLRSWMSCHSCHTEGHTSGILSDTQGDGSYGAPKRVPSLLGVGQSGPWAWTGQMASLSAQIEKSLRTTLHASPVTPEQVGVLEAYLRTLEPPQLPAAAEDAEAARRGEAAFHQRCAGCHTPSAYTSAGTYDVGLADEMGNRRFNPPSLRGVRHRSPLFHDGRARDLDDVLTRFRHPVGELPSSEVHDLIAFLKTI